MPNINSSEHIFIVAGMHRSGTSFVASLLQSAGVDIGQKLLGANESNIKGHFEDIDFVSLHENILRSQGISVEGWTLEQSIQVQEQYLDRAKLLIRGNATKQVWGWKDPRTTLFLKFWAELIPEAKFIFVYRSPWEVLDSLYRRGDEAFQSNPTFALQVWLNYNRAILDFYDRFSEQSILLNLSQITRNPAVVAELIETKFCIALSSVAELYEESLLQRQISSSHRPTLIKHYFPEAFDLYQELNTRVSLIHSSSPLPDEPIRFSPYQAWVFQDWLELRRREKELKQLNSQHQQIQSELERSQVGLQNTQAELQNTQAELQNTQAELERSQVGLQNTQAELQNTQAELERSQVGLQNTQAELQNTQAELERSQAQLQHSQAELERSQAQLQHSQAELEHAKLIIKAMNSSKFWKLRKVWFKLKQTVGFSDDE